MHKIKPVLLKYKNYNYDHEVGENRIPQLYMLLKTLEAFHDTNQ